MSDTPKLHVYAVALYFGIPSEGALGGVTSTVWSAYTPGEATAWAVDASHRAAVRDGKILGPFAGHAVMEITEEHLSSLLNSIRTGGKGATVLQAVPQMVARLGVPEDFQIDNIASRTLCQHQWVFDYEGQSGKVRKHCTICGARDPGNAA